MIEKEVKAKINGKPEIIVKKLHELGFKLSGIKHQVDVYYSHPCFNFKERDVALRLRYENGEAFLTYKGPRLSEQIKIREEIEAKTCEPDKIHEILKHLGFRILAVVRKERKEFAGQGDKKLKVLLDYIEDLGYFLEIEGENERQIYEIYNKLEKYGLRIVQKTYLEMILKKENEGYVKDL